MNSYSIFCFILIVSSVAPCIINCTLCKLISTERIINFLSDFSTAIEFLFLHKHSQMHSPPHFTALRCTLPVSDEGEEKRDEGKISMLIPRSHLKHPGIFRVLRNLHQSHAWAMISAAEVTSKALLDVTSRASTQGPLG